MVALETSYWSNSPEARFLVCQTRIGNRFHYSIRKHLSQILFNSIVKTKYIDDLGKVYLCCMHIWGGGTESLTSPLRTQIAEQFPSEIICSQETGDEEWAYPYRYLQ